MLLKSRIGYLPAETTCCLFSIYGHIWTNMPLSIYLNGPSVCYSEEILRWANNDWVLICSLNSPKCLREFREFIVLSVLEGTKDHLERVFTKDWGFVISCYWGFSHHSVNGCFSEVDRVMRFSVLLFLVCSKGIFPLLHLN